MTADHSDAKPRGDKMTTDFFENVLLTYLEEDRLESGVLRLDLDDGRTRRIVVEEDTESLDPYEYLLRELEEVIFLLEENEDLLSEPVELSIPVGDADRVVAEAREAETVTTLFGASGITTVLEHLRDLAASEREQADEDTSGE